MKTNDYCALIPHCVALCIVIGMPSHGVVTGSIPVPPTKSEKLKTRTAQCSAGFLWNRCSHLGKDPSEIYMRNGFGFISSIGVRIVLLCVMQCVTNAFAGTPGEIPVGGQLPEASLSNLAGGMTKLSSFRGKPLLINVWASWCGPCRDEMGSLDRLSRRYGGKEFNIIGISTDDDRAAAVRFINTSKIPFLNFIDRNLVLENMLGADRLPLTVLVDADGNVIKRIAGSRAWDSPESINLIVNAFRLRVR